MKHSLKNSVHAGTRDLWHIFFNSGDFFLTSQYDKSCETAENRWSFPLNLLKDPCWRSCSFCTDKAQFKIKQGHTRPTCMSSMSETSCCLTSCGDRSGITVSSTVTSVWAAGLQCWEKSQVSSSSLDRTTEIKVWGKHSAWCEVFTPELNYITSSKDKQTTKNTHATS